MKRKMNKNIKPCYTTDKNQNRIRNIKSHENINTEIRDKEQDKKRREKPDTNKKNYYDYI